MILKPLDVAIQGARVHRFIMVIVWKQDYLHILGEFLLLRTKQQHWHPRPEIHPISDILAGFACRLCLCSDRATSKQHDGEDENNAADHGFRWPPLLNTCIGDNSAEISHFGAAVIRQYWIALV